MTESTKPAGDSLIDFVRESHSIKVPVFIGEDFGFVGVIDGYKTPYTATVKLYQGGLYISRTVQVKNLLGFYIGIDLADVAENKQDIRNSGSTTKRCGPIGISQVSSSTTQASLLQVNHTKRVKV